MVSEMDDDAVHERALRARTQRAEAERDDLARRLAKALSMNERLLAKLERDQEVEDRLDGLERQGQAILARLGSRRSTGSSATSDDGGIEYRVKAQMAARARLGRKNLSPRARRRVEAQARELGVIDD